MRAATGRGPYNSRFEKKIILHDREGFGTEKGTKFFVIMGTPSGGGAETGTRGEAVRCDGGCAIAAVSG
jgi:hypothetical protein